MLVYENSSINIIKNQQQADKLLHPWFGAAKLVKKWQKEGTIEKYSISKQEYEENGAEYF